jgi:hypothetical protein
LKNLGYSVENSVERGRSNRGLLLCCRSHRELARAFGRRLVVERPILLEQLHTRNSEQTKTKEATRASVEPMRPQATGQAVCEPRELPERDEAWNEKG